MAKLPLEERLEIMQTIDQLWVRYQAGEKVDKELRKCGKLLGDSDVTERNPNKRAYTKYNKKSLQQALRNKIPRQTFWGRITHYQWSEWEAANIPPRMTRKKFYEQRKAQ